MKAWGGRFGGAPDEASAAFGRSIDVDAELPLDDITASIAEQLDAKGVTDEEIERDFVALKKRRRR